MLCFDCERIGRGRYSRIQLFKIVDTRAFVTAHVRGGLLGAVGMC